MDPKFSARIASDLLESDRESCEDKAFDKDPKNAESVNKIECYGQFMCKKMTNAFGEWKGFEIPEVKYDYN